MRKKRASGTNKEDLDASKSTTKTQEEGIGPQTTRNHSKEMKAAAGKDLGATSTANPPLFLNEDENDGPDAVTSRSEPTDSVGGRDEETRAGGLDKEAVVALTSTTKT